MTGEEFLQAISEVCDVRRLILGPGDTVVFLMSEHISQRGFDAFLDMAKASFPNNRVMVLDGGIDITVVSDETAANLLNLSSENQE